MGFDNDAGTVVSCSYRSDSHSRERSERRSVTHCQTVSETVGSDGSCVQRNTFWPAVHETLTVVAQDQGVFPEGESTSHDQGHVAMLTCLRHVEENLWSCNANDGRLRHVLGSGHEWPLCPRSVGRPSSHVTHQLPGDVGRVSSYKTLPSRPKGTSCACPHRQHISGLLHKSAGGVCACAQAGVPGPPVGSGKAPLTQSSIHPWASQSGSRHPVETGAEAQGMEVPPRGGGAPLGRVRPGRSRSICVTGNDTLSALVLPHTSSSAWAGCHGTDVAEASSVRISPNRSAPGSSGESTPGGVCLLLVALFWPA